MKKKLALITTLLVAAIVLAGCNTNSTVESDMIIPQTAEETLMLENIQPPVTASTEIDDMEKEIDGTVISEEDFSDL